MRPAVGDLLTDQRPRSTSSPSSSISARSAASAGSPNAANSDSTPPIPAAKTARPPLRTSRVATWWARTCGRRRGSGRQVRAQHQARGRAATAASVTQGSAAGEPQTNDRWSQTSSASQPAASASSASCDHVTGIAVRAEVGEAEAVAHRRTLGASSRMATCRRTTSAPSRRGRTSTPPGASSSPRSRRTWTCGATSWRRSPPPGACARATARSRTGKVLLEHFGEPVLEIATDRSAAGLDEVDLAVMDLAERVVDDATSIDDADLQRLRDLGLSDEEIMDVVLTAAVRCFWTKTLDALGVQADASYARARARAARGARRRPPDCRRLSLETRSGATLSRLSVGLRAAPRDGGRPGTRPRRGAARPRSPRRALRRTARLPAASGRSGACGRPGRRARPAAVPDRGPPTAPSTVLRARRTGRGARRGGRRVRRRPARPARPTASATATLRRRAAPGQRPPGPTARRRPSRGRSSRRRSTAPPSANWAPPRPSTK